MPFGPRDLVPNEGSQPAKTAQGYCLDRGAPCYSLVQMPSTSDPLAALADVIRKGLPGSPQGGVTPLLEALFGGVDSRYHKRHLEKSSQGIRSPIVRDAYALAGEDQGAVPFAGLIHPENPPSGAYGGASVVWMPTEDAGSIITFVVGTKGLSPDEGLLTRPGHRRRIAALRSWLAKHEIEAWSKPDPAALDSPVPESVQKRFAPFKSAFRRYGREFYCAAEVPENSVDARVVVQAFLDLYAHERGWQVSAKYRTEFDEFIQALNKHVFPEVSDELVYKLLQERRFVILQGPPGTGKSFLAQRILRSYFGAHGNVIQFHPAITYEDFVVGLSPDIHEQGTLRFDVRKGWLVEAVEKAKQGPCLLVIDEINRADLGKVLGEAIYLFEASEIGEGRSRTVDLPHAVDGERSLSLPQNLYVGVCT